MIDKMWAHVKYKADGREYYLHSYLALKCYIKDPKSVHTWVVFHIHYILWAGQKYASHNWSPVEELHSHWNGEQIISIIKFKIIKHQHNKHNHIYDNETPTAIFMLRILFFNTYSANFIASIHFAFMSSVFAKNENALVPSFFAIMKELFHYKIYQISNVYIPPYHTPMHSNATKTQTDILK